jgi:hypothetical protein
MLLKNKHGFLHYTRHETFESPLSLEECENAFQEMDPPEPIPAIPVRLKRMQWNELNPDLIEFTVNPRRSRVSADKIYGRLERTENDTTRIMLELVMDLRLNVLVGIGFIVVVVLSLARTYSPIQTLLFTLVFAGFFVFANAYEIHANRLNMTKAIARLNTLSKEIT